MILNNVMNFSYTGNSEKIALPPGVYKFECWGAQGYTANSVNIGGKGAYVKGNIRLRKARNFYIFVGQYGRSGYANYVFNGGGCGQYTGGGASDIRLTDGNWYDFSSLRSRIIVAAGGGGPDSDENAGPGGTIDGISSKHGEGGHQTRGGSGVGSGSFGKGGCTTKTGTSGCGGGGSGYYGGGSSSATADYSGGGGSSFISGYQGCIAITKESTEEKITPKSDSFHYSGLSFEATSMIGGDSLMPSPTSSSYETGHASNGYVRITQLSLLSNICTCHGTKTHFKFLITRIIILCTY